MHLIFYIFEGVIHKFYPDFIVRLKNKRYLVLETKGADTQKDKTKRNFLDEWVKAINQHGGFGEWTWAVSKHPSDLKSIIQISPLREVDALRTLKRLREAGIVELKESG